MPSNSKADNQYFGKYLERAVVEHINQTNITIDPTQYHDLNGYNFSDQEIKELNKEAKKIASYLGKTNIASYIGNHTSTQTGDICLNNNTYVELKRVSSGSGTYYNTSVFYLKDYGYDFKNYMAQYNLYETIEHYFPMVRVSKTNNSPVSTTSSSIIRHSNNEEGKQAIAQVDEKLRTAFVADIVQHFIDYPEVAYNFIMDMLNKVRLRTQQSSKPDRLIVYNYVKDTISEINLQDIDLNINNIENRGLGFIIGPLRIQIGWQNGNGLNNPTIRVFFR